MGKLAGLIVGFLVLGIVFGVAERLWPSTCKSGFWRRRDIKTDLLYWLFTPVVTKFLSQGAVLIAVVLLAVAAGVPFDKEHIQAFAEARGRVSTQPVILQVMEILILADLIGYASHRLFHGRRLWRFHAVHHSSTQLDWLSSVRVHPVNDAASKVANVVGLLTVGSVVGFRPALVAGALPFLVFYAIGLHANVSWSFGPLRYVIASPAFHRWHHTTQEEGLDKNFAGLFPWIDLLFGTFYLPRDRQPEHFGIRDSDVPEGFLQQLAYPFRSRQSRARLERIVERHPEQGHLHQHHR